MLRGRPVGDITREWLDERRDELLARVLDVWEDATDAETKARAESLMDQLMGGLMSFRPPAGATTQRSAYDVGSEAGD